MKRGARAGRRRCCSSRSCSSRVSVPDESVGDVMGDLSSRRGRPLGTEAVGGMTEVKAEVPMAEMLTYAPDLRSITGGQGEYTMEFPRYEEVPAHLAQKVVDAAQKEHEAVARRPGSAACARRRRVATLAGAVATHARHQDQPAGHRLRRLRAHAAARRARRALPGRRPAPPGLRAVHGARAARGLDPRVRRRRARRCAPQPRRPRRVFGRLRARRERAREDGDAIAAEEAARHRAAAARRAAASGEREREREPDVPAEAQRRPRHVHAVPTNAELKMERALEVFNGSEHPRTVGGVARSLGAPEVCVRPLRAPQRRVDHRDVGAQLVPLRGRPLRRGRRRPRASPRAPSCPSSTTREREANAAADERGRCTSSEAGRQTQQMVDAPAPQRVG